MLRNFSVISKISLRNLVRQKRRNILLGICMILVMAILVLTTSFTNGLSDIIFNQLLVVMTGHITVQAVESTSVLTEVVRDAPRLVDVIKSNVDGVTAVDQIVTITSYSRILSSGQTAMAFPVGLRPDNKYFDNLTMVSGTPQDLFKKDLYPGLLLYKTLADNLNVRLGDTVTFEFTNVFKGPEAPQFKVVGLIQSENMFMDMACFVNEQDLTRILGMYEQEKISLNIIVSYPDDIARIIQQADRLHKALQAAPAGVRATLALGGKNAPADVFALRLKSDEKARALAAKELQFVSGGFDTLAKTANGIVLTEPLARSLDARVGQRLSYSYTTKYEYRNPGSSKMFSQVAKEAVVAGVVKAVPGFGEATAFAPDSLFYQHYFWHLPAERPTVRGESALTAALLPEWEMLERTPDTDTSMKKFQRLYRERWDGTRLDVSTMFETGQAALQMQAGLNTISIIAVLILSVVIIIGVVNTMRMTIRERTREIGTNRAIGMQGKDVRSVFVFEIFYLSIGACLVGILVAFGLMGLLSAITINVQDNIFGMFLPKQHLYFVPTVSAIVSFFIVIVGFSFFIAFMTARRAARMRVADALRHYE